MVSPSLSADALPDIWGPVPTQRRVAGRVTLPGSKSVTQRYLCLALVGYRDIVIHRPLLSDDTRRFIEGLETVGMTVTLDGERLEVAAGTLPTEDDARTGTIFCGAGGTMLRFLTAALTVVPGRWRLDGVQRLRERPLAPLIDALRVLGASITCLEQEGFAPLEIVGGSLSGGRARLDAGESSQYLSALLMTACGAPAEIEIEVEALTSEPYVDLTLAAIRDFGGAVERDESVWRPRRGLGSPREVSVEGDFSAAAYPAAGAALTGGTVLLEPLGSASLQGDRGFIDLLGRMGAEVKWHQGALAVDGGGTLRALEVDLGKMPDQVPTMAALAPFALGTTRIRGVPHLRLKESDRLAAMTTELRRVGATVEEHDDGLTIPGIWADTEPPEEPVICESWDDHRIAMAMALVGLRRRNLFIRHPGVVSKSYPAFWEDLEGLCHR
ncbi:MAG: 3-phosphoshikimate 1-carboxyvinyltransferase [Acidobacteriota bacterium]